MENFGFKIGLNYRQKHASTANAYSTKVQSEEHKRKFTTENADFQMVQALKNKTCILIEGQPIRE